MTIEIRKPPQTLLGDQIEKTLASWGITPEKYVEIKRRFGLPASCNCAARKAYLNRVHAWWKEQGNARNPKS